MDNCTLFPDGSWSKCCARHDRRYENRRLSRREADKLLFRCVVRRGKPVCVHIPGIKKEWIETSEISITISPSAVASVMYVGVRVFGLPWYVVARVRKSNLKRRA